MSLVPRSVATRLLAAVGLFLCAVSARGAILKTWDGDAGVSWQTPANWDANALPDFTNGDNITISGAANVTGMTLDGNVTVNTFTINTLSGMTLGSGTGGTMTLASGALTRNNLTGTEGSQSISCDILLGASGTWTINGSNSLAISGTISDGGHNYGLAVGGGAGGPSTLTLSGPNSFGGQLNKTGTCALSINGLQTGSGLLTVNGGTVNIGGTGRATNGGNVTLTSGVLAVASGGVITGGGNIDANGGTLTLNGTGTTGTGTLTVAGSAATIGAAGKGVDGSGNVVVNASTLAITSGGVATASGETTINGGTLTLANDAALGSSTNAISLGGAATNAKIVLGAAGNSLSRNITVVSGGAGASTMASTAGGEYGGTVTLNKSLYVDATAGVTTFSGNIVNGSGTNQIIKGAGVGIVSLTGLSNTYNGGSVILGGMLTGSGIRGNVALGGTGQAGGVWGGSGTFNRSLGIGPTQVQWITGGGFSAYGGDLTVDLGTLNSPDDLTWGSGNFVATGSSLILSNVNSANTTTFADNINLGASPRTVQVNNGTANIDAVLSGVLSGSGSLTKAGAGKLQLSGNNSFFGGGVIVNAGTLYITNINALGAGTLTLAGAIENGNAGLMTIGNNLSLSTANVATAGGNITFSESTPTLTAATTMTVNNAQTTISGVLGGGFILTKGGTGELILSNSSNSVGGITLSAGTLTANGAGALGAGTLTLGGGTLAFNSGSPVVVTNALSLTGSPTIGAGDSVEFSSPLTLAGGRTITSNTTTTLSGLVTGAYKLTSSGSGKLVLLHDNSTSTLTGVTAGAGTLGIGHNNALGGGTLTVSSGASLSSEGGTHGVSNAVTFSANANFVGSNDLSLTGNISQTANGIFDVTGGMKVTLGNLVSASARTMTKNGLGTLALAGNLDNKLSTVTVNAGTLSLEKTANLSIPSTVALNVNGGAVILTQGSQMGTGIVTMTGGTFAVGATATVNSASMLTFNGSGVYAGSGTFSRSLGTTGSDKVQWAAGKGGGFAAYGGDLNVDLGGAGANNYTWGTTTSFIGAATLYLGSPLADHRIAFLDNIDLGTANRTVYVDDNTASTGDRAEISGNLTGSSRTLTKDGPGLLTLAGSDSFGSLVVLAGGLNATGGSHQISNVTIGGAGATLGGTGTITSSGTVRVGSNAAASRPGEVDPGNYFAALGVGTLAVHGNMIFGDVANNNAGTLNIDLASTGHDRLDITGNLDLTSLSALNLNFVGGFIPREDCILATYTGSLTGQFHTITGLPAWGQVLYSTPGEILLAVPEPGTLCLLALGGAMMAVRRRRK